MKKIIYILALSSIIMMSCKKEFLIILPESMLTSDLVYKTDKDFKDAIVGSYVELTDFYRYYWEFGELPGDDCKQYNLRNTTAVRIDGFSIDVDDVLLSNTWRDLYQVIERVNTILSKIESADVSAVPNKEVYIGEAKFVRALAYFNLVRIFGDVPMLTGPTNVQDALKTTRTSVDIIYNEVIIKDLLEAEVKLPTTQTTTNIGRATKGAAKSLLGLVYLTRQDFPKAESKLLEVTTMGYELLENFSDLFNFTDEHHSEYIFDIEFTDGNIGLGSSFQGTFMPQVQDCGRPFINALISVYNLPATFTGGGTEGTPNLDFVALFEPNDLRKDITVATGIFDLTGTWVPIAPDSPVPAMSKKYMTHFVIESDGKANWRVIRYADVLLMLAEALNENNKSDEALDYLNMVRVRAGLLGYSGLTKSDAREKIYLERRFELYLEGSRWFDLLRTGRAFETMAAFGMKSYQTVFPIPQSQIEVVNNSDIFAQNEGY